MAREASMTGNPNPTTAPRIGGPARRRRLVLAALGIAALAFITYAHALGSIGLLGPDEPRYAEIAAAMAARHDYVTPRLLGEGWFEKPVLYYWVAAAGFHAWGGDDADARRPNAILGLLLLLALALFLARVRGARAAALAAMLAASAAFLFGFARAAVTDMPLTAALSWTLMALFLWLRERRRAWLWLAAACLGLAVLAKGPVAVVLVAGVLVLLAWWQGHGEWITRALSPVAIAIFFAVSAPWYVLVSLRNPQFPKLFFWQQNIERFTTDRFAHPQPFWFFLPILFLAVFPWSGWSLVPVCDAWRGRRRPRRLERVSLARFLWLWVLVPLVFFSASHSKLPSYILPAVPALVLLTAVAMDGNWDELPRWPGYISAALAALIAAMLVALPWFYGGGAVRAALPRIPRDGGVWAAALGTFVVLALLVWRRRWLAYFVLTCALVGFGVFELTGPWSGRMDDVLSARPLAAAIDNACGAAAFVPLPLTAAPAPSSPAAGFAGPWRPAAAAQAPFANGPCAGGALYEWRLNRDFIYGMYFYLHRAPRDLAAGPWPPQALVAVPRREVESFVALAVANRRTVAAAATPPLGASWTLFKLGPPRAGDQKP